MTKFKRGLLALPFLILFYLSLQKLDASSALIASNQVIERGHIEWGSNSVPVVDKFFGIGWLDDLWCPIVVIFSQWYLGFDEVGSWQTFSFLTDFGLLYSILLFEASRRESPWRLTRLAALFGMAAQVRGAGLVVNIYYFLYCAVTSTSPALQRTDTAWTASIFPAMTFGYYVPLFLETFAGSAVDRQKWNHLWQLFPLWVSLFQILLYPFMPKPNASQSKSPQATSRGEKSIIRYTIGIFTIFSSITWLYTIIYSPFTLAEMFVPSWDPPSVSGPEDIVANMLNFIQFDYLFCWISTAVWLVLLFKDLKDAGVVEKSWVSLCALGLGMVVIFGPGAASGLAWSVREEILASREFVDDEKMR